MALTVLTELGIDVADDVHDVFVGIPLVVTCHCFSSTIHARHDVHVF